MMEETTMITPAETCGHASPGQRAATFVIADMACSHEGDPRLRHKIIDGVGQAAR